MISSFISELSNVIGLSSVEELVTLPANLETRAIVTDPVRGGEFLYDESLVPDSDNGLIFNGWVRQYSGAVDVRWFPTTQLAIDSGKSIVFKDFVFSESQTLIFSHDDITISGISSTVSATGIDSTVFEITGANVIVDGITIDGNNSSCRGIHATGDGFIVKNCNISNLTGTVNQAVGIDLDGVDNYTISDNTISNVTATSNLAIADSTGSSRGIKVHSLSGAIYGGVITNNNLSQITGEEGDAIQILYYSGAGAFLDAKCVIKSNYISDFNRRGIKLQANKINVVNNEIAATLPKANVINGAFCINSISSDDILIHDNRITSESIAGIGVSGESLNISSNNTIRDNTLVIATELAHDNTGDTVGMYVVYTSNANIFNNSIVGGVNGLLVGTSDNLTISGNMFSGGLNTSVGIRILSDCNYIGAISNVDCSGIKGDFINNTSASSTLLNNLSLSDTNVWVNN